MTWVPILFLLFKGGVLFVGMFYAIKWHYDQDRNGQGPSRDAQWSAELRLFATMLVALTLAISGIVYAGCWGDHDAAGYGGALAFALSLGVFLTTGPADLPEARDGQGRDDAVAGEGGISAPGLAHHRASVWREKIYFSIAISISTLAWVYGHIAAGWFDFGR